MISWLILLNSLVLANYCPCSAPPTNLRMGAQNSIIPVSNGNDEPSPILANHDLKEEKSKLDKTSITLGSLTPVSKVNSLEHCHNKHYNFSTISHSHEELLAYADSIAGSVDDSANSEQIRSPSVKVVSELLYTYGFLMNSRASRLLNQLSRVP